MPLREASHIPYIFPYLESWGPHLESWGPILVAKARITQKRFKPASELSEIAQMCYKTLKMPQSGSR
eukprot:949688-Prymnesium_polylepis.1